MWIDYEQSSLNIRADFIPSHFSSIINVKTSEQATWQLIPATCLLYWRTSFSFQPFTTTGAQLASKFSIKKKIKHHCLLRLAWNLSGLRELYRKTKYTTYCCWGAMNPPQKIKPTDQNIWLILILHVALGGGRGGESRTKYLLHVLLPLFAFWTRKCDSQHWTRSTHVPQQPMFNLLQLNKQLHEVCKQLSLTHDGVQLTNQQLSCLLL